MKLEKFKEKNQKKKITIGICIVLVLLVAGIIVYRSFAFYEEKKAFDVIKGQVPDQNYDLKLSYYVDNNYQETMPEETNYSVSVTCSDGATGEWDYEVWGPVITNLTSTRTKCKLSFQTGGYKEEILNGTDPVLKDGLIPVVISDDGTVKRAKLSEEWYSYVNQRWANAVILEDESKKYYEGEVIPESNIESYFVWIPKYRYKLWDLGQYTSLSSNVQKKEQTIDVIFGDYDTIDKEGECKTPGISGSTGNCKVGDYMTHPAFQAFGVKGLWVGKFETGYKGATSTAGAESNTYDTSKVIIKPNVYSWRNINVSNAHLNSYNYKREYDSHMMKNTEWGAIAYLQHSIYGSRKSVRINNNEAFITGYAAKNEPTTGSGLYSDLENTALKQNGSSTFIYNTDYGKLASTTANIAGIYDMSGGAYEPVMGVMLSSDNKTPCSGSSAYISVSTGFAGPYSDKDEVAEGEAFPEKRYYDVYQYSTSNTQYTRKILGDAAGELGPFANTVYGTKTISISSWYDDYANFLDTTRPWFSRGGYYAFGSNCGMFTFSYSYGNAAVNGSYRIVLAI